MTSHLWFVACVYLSAVVVVQAEENVFIKKENADQLLLRRKRANSGFEELKKGNLERECVEERCSKEEAREVFENDHDTEVFWNKYIDGDQCESNPCHYGGSCKDGIGEYTCVCLERHQGKNCEFVTPELCSLDNGGCEQFCKATGQNMKCSCTTGYVLGEDKKSCIPTETFACGKIKTVRVQRSVTGNEQSVNDSTTEVPQQNNVTSANLTNSEPLPTETSNKINTTNSPQEEKKENSGDGRIVGGRDCKPGECPWQAVLVDENQKRFCGGTILSKYFILTAAHCMNESTYFEVVVGEVDTRKKEGTESVHKVEKILAHQKFKKQTYDSDIAILKLKEPINFTQYIIPVCLPDVDFADDVLMAKDAKAIVSGFGYIRQGGPQATTLQVLSVPYIDRATCIDSSQFAITPNMFCAGYDAEVKDACQGDSGGPHVTSYKDTYFITGVISWGEGCARKGKYGVYTKVSRFYKWIKAAMRIKA